MPVSADIPGAAERDPDTPLGRARRRASLIAQARADRPPPRRVHSGIAPGGEVVLPGNERAGNLVYDIRAKQDIRDAVMQVSKWGNSLAVRLPKALVTELGLKSGDELEIVSATAERIAVAKDERRALAVERMRARAWRIPEGHAFDRDEANAR